MPKEKQRRTRVIGLPKNYKYKDWLHSALNIAEPAIDYFKFADTFSDSESATNHHYADLLTKLSTGQSNKLTKISTTAKKLYNSRNNLETDFGKQYKQYWETRDTLNIQKALRNENQRTIIHLNELTNKEIRNLAEKTYNINESINEADEDYETNETEGEHEEEISDESSIAEKVISQTANLASDDRVGKLKIIDLSSSAAVDILKTETSGDQFESILEATKIHPITMSTEACNLIKCLNDATLSVQELRKTLYRHGFNENFDLIANHNMGFLEVTTRHFLDLMNSPNNPLNKIMLERTAATYLIIFIVNQLFLPDNDIIEAGWLEREFYSTEKTKFDGILFKVGNKTIVAGLLEFSGGVNDRTPSSKNTVKIPRCFVLDAMLHMTTTFKGLKELNAYVKKTDVPIFCDFVQQNSENLMAWSTDKAYMAAKQLTHCGEIDSPLV
ncbi:hypothetical protein G6F46_008981 [Rhizopus delemar]|uniref:Uncharacterized protein n=2 Tax=Rhizopus TaxID=4842 RepID=A0A9P6YZR0_9FUNG|nr:hypothetical protein G6F54_008473 [Rhizopus delemar]KAG1540653.1 hypothetical protein G6F51_008394 [Rhizopus arrhizus]KAG1507755.1 hypothetical protein G6F53_008706 [Rhizopus delemar]KAG1520433.1 hypothetical protein G6F52_007669 [Rhizopus delemar]KAG1548715.1 hypothetical protein G6F49_009820 [Rhizopus delemar]